MKRMVLCLVVFGLFLTLNDDDSLAFDRQQTKSQIQFNQDVENIFQKSINHYRDGRYQVVESELENLLDIYPQNHRITAILYLMGRAQYKQEKFEKAEETFLRLINQYPSSSYRDDARYLMAAISYKRKNYMEIANHLFTVLETTKDKRLWEDVQSQLFPLVTDYLTLDEIEQLKERYREEESQNLLQFARGVHQFRRNKKDLSVNILQELLNQNPSYPLKNKVEHYLKLVETAPAAGIKIGVILPLSGYLEEEANAMLRGIKYAFNRHSLAKELNIDLIVKDSRGEVMATIRATRELMEEGVMAIIGEIESDKTAVIGALSQRENIPLFAPTAAKTGLTTLVDNVIQMTPDIGSRGESIAEYAVNKLNLNSFVILAPADQYGKTITDKFAETVDELSGKILAESWYYEGATDLRKQFKNFREIGLKKMLRDSISMANPEFTLTEIDSVIDEIKKEKLRKRMAEDQPETPDFADSTATPVTSIDAIFLPIYNEEIPYAAPQFAMYNIQCQILGGSYWNDEETLDNNKSYISGCVFLSDFFIDESDFKYQKFKNRFRMDTGTSPGKMDIYGYDVMNFLLRGFSSDTNSPKSLLTKFKEIKHFNGLLHPYNFRKNERMNSFLHILRYNGNTIEEMR